MALESSKECRSHTQLSEFRHAGVRDLSQIAAAVRTPTDDVATGTALAKRDGIADRDGLAPRVITRRRPTTLPSEEDMAFALEKTLLERSKNGDAHALSELCTALTPHIERQLLRYPVAEEDRRDLLQATLMQVIRRLDSFRGDSSFSTWLFRVTANEALMLMRSQRRHRARLIEGLEWEDLAALPAMNDAEHHLSSESRAEIEQRDAQIRAALEELPEDYRNVVALHYHMDLGLQEIADRLSITESAVRSRLHRARSRLRSLLSETAIGREMVAEAFAALTANDAAFAA